MGQRIKRMEAMLDALLQYSKVGSNESEAEAIDSGELVRAVIDYLGLPEQFKAEVADNMPVIATQRAPMELVFRNLISNAVKHHDRDSGTIRVSGEQRGKICAFTVSDDGPGIPEKHQEGVFEMFKTLRPRDEVEGSGMGSVPIAAGVSAVVVLLLGLALVAAQINQRLGQAAEAVQAQRYG